MTTQYEYVFKNNPATSLIPTLVKFSDESGLKIFEQAIEAETVTTNQPHPAGYAKMTTSQAKKNSIASDSGYINVFTWG